jgi:hypothetical protein
VIRILPEAFANLEHALFFDCQLSEQILQHGQVDESGTTTCYQDSIRF